MQLSKKQLKGIGAAVGLLVAASGARAASISLLPTQWNTISNGSYTANSDGSGYHIFAGGGREGLVQFNLSSIPAGSTINSVTLSMYMDRSSTSSPANQPIFMYRVSDSWGMGNSGANQVDNGVTGGGGMLYTATSNDATWNYRFYNSSTPSSSINWTNAGGDFAASASAYSLVGEGMASTGTPGAGGPLLTSWSGAGLISDVQNWLTGTTENDGWLMTDYANSTDYPPSGNAFASDISRRFISASNNLNGTSGTSNDLPYLTITYTAVPEPAMFGLLTTGTLGLLRRRRRV